jgi:hypothetical protein
MNIAAKPWALALTLCLLVAPAGSTCRAGFVTLAACSAGNLETIDPGTRLQSYSFALTSGNLMDTSGSQYGTPIVQSAVVFDLSALPKGAIIANATLEMTTDFYQATSISQAGMRVYGSAFPGPSLTQDDFFGTSYELGWANLPGADGFAPTTLSFDVTSLARSGGQDLGFILDVSGNVESYGTGALNPAYAPSLIITYSPAAVPEPSSLALCGIAVVAALVAGRGPMPTRAIRSGRQVLPRVVVGSSVTPFASANSGRGPASGMATIRDKKGH